MEKSYLNEAFQALDMLNEDTFDISTEGTEDLKNFLDDEDNTNLITIDGELIKIIDILDIEKI